MLGATGASDYALEKWRSRMMWEAAQWPGNGLLVMQMNTGHTSAWQPSTCSWNPLSLGFLICWSQSITSVLNGIVQQSLEPRACPLVGLLGGWSLLGSETDTHGSKGIALVGCVSWCGYVLLKEAYLHLSCTEVMAAFLWINSWSFQSFCPASIQHVSPNLDLLSQ